MKQNSVGLLIAPQKWVPIPQGLAVAPTSERSQIADRRRGVHLFPLKLWSCWTKVTNLYKI